MFSYEYPLYLAKDCYPYTKIGQRNVVIYWGNEHTHGEEGQIPFGDSEELVFKPDSAQEKPESYTKVTGIFTEVVMGWWVFRFENFALDLSQEKIEVSEMLPRIGHKIEYRKHDSKEWWSSLPLVEATIRGTKYLFQVDIGDRYSSVPPELVEGQEPIRTEMLVPYGSFRERRKVKVYEVPIRLSEDVEIVTEAVVISKGDEAGYMYTGTNGCIGVDLIRNHRVTFTPETDEEDPAMYFKPFSQGS